MGNDELKIDRILLLVGSVVYCLWGNIFLYLNENFHDPFWQRLVISSLVLCLFFLTFLSVFVRKQLRKFNYFLIYLATLQQFHLMWHNNFSSEYFIGLIVIIVSLNAYFNTIKQLFLYGFVVVVFMIISLYLKSDFSSQKIVFFLGSTLTINVFLTLIYSLKIKSQNDLRLFAVELIESEDKFKQLMESAPDAMVILNEDGFIVNINDEAEKLFAYKENELLNQSIEVLIPERFRNTSLKNENYYVDKSEKRKMCEGVELYGLTKENKEFPLEIKLSSIKQINNSNITIASITNLTTKKQVESELNEAKELLKIQEIKDKISEGKSEFISKMSHEIRTPLNGIFGFTDLLLKEELNEKQLKYVNSVRFSCDILLTFINDILDYSKFESKSIVLENQEVNIQNLMDDLIYIFNDPISLKKIKITKKYEHEVNLILGDKNRISQIIMNLLSNAIKFSPLEGEIIITLTSTKEKTISIKIQDFGIGIPLKDREIIFEPFIQGDKQIAKNYGGTGLGLNIVKNLVELMEGKVSLDSKVFKGSTFIVDLPIKEFIAENPANINSDLKNHYNGNEKDQLLKNKEFKILLVEDNLINQYLVEVILEKHAYNLDIANNGVEASNLLDKNVYDLILMDLMMPIMDGYQTTTYIRKTLKLNVPIVILTADVKALDNQKFADGEKDFEFDAYIKKPFEVDELLATITKFQTNGKL